MTTLTRDELQALTDRANVYIAEEFELYGMTPGSLLSAALPRLTPGMVRAVLAVLPDHLQPATRVDTPDPNERLPERKSKRKSRHFGVTYDLTNEEMRTAALATIRRIAGQNDGICSMADFDQHRRDLPTSSGVRGRLRVNWAELVAEALDNNGSNSPSDGTEADPPAAGDPFPAPAHNHNGLDR